MAEIGCIILTSDLHEKESFSFEQQSDYIYNSLNNRIWIMNDINNQAIINNSFKSINNCGKQMWHGLLWQSSKGIYVWLDYKLIMSSICSGLTQICKYTANKITQVIRGKYK